MYTTILNVFVGFPSRNQGCGGDDDGGRDEGCEVDNKPAGEDEEIRS